MNCSNVGNEASTILPPIKLMARLLKPFHSNTTSKLDFHCQNIAQGKLKYTSSKYIHGQTHFKLHQRKILLNTRIRAALPIFFFSMHLLSNQYDVAIFMVRLCEYTAHHHSSSFCHRHSIQKHNIYSTYRCESDMERCQKEKSHSLSHMEYKMRRGFICAAVCSQHTYKNEHSVYSVDWYIQ